MERTAIVKTLKIAGWTLLGLVALAVALLFGGIKFLESKYLAPMLERVANDYIDGEVKIGEMKLGFRPKFPILSVDVEDLSVISHAFDSLSTQQRGLLPNYSDSLLTLGHMSGAIDIRRLLKDNELSLHDVEFDGLSVNLVIAHDGKANYDIISLPTDTADTKKKKMPGFRIDRFSLTHPKEIRFYNAADSVAASVLLLTDAAVDGGDQPTYRLKVSGDVTSPQATLLTNLEKISFGVNGKVRWNPEEPGLVAMDEMELQGAFLKAVVSGEIDLTESPIVKKGRVDLKPVAVTDMLAVLPDSIREAHGLFSPNFTTDAAISGLVELTAPMNLATDTLPTARINISMAPAFLNYGQAHLKDLALDVEVNTLTNKPDSIRVDVRMFSVAGPGTQLQGDALLTTMISDPTFDVGLVGKLDFRDLPPILLEKIPGYLAGVLTTDLRAKGSTSMFRPERLHHLVADGTVTARGVYFLTGDTSKMVQVGNARIDLDSKRMVDGLPLLSTKVAVDTATILVSGVDLALGSISLNAGMDGVRKDTTLMMPVNGNLKVGRFNITALKDSAGARIFDISGPVRIRGLKGNGGLPELSTDLKIGGVSAGTMSDRVVLDNTIVKASLSKEVKKKVKSDDANKDNSDHKADKPYKLSKLNKQSSYIAPKDVYKYVRWKRAHGKHVKRVYGATGADDDEILVWNLTKQFRHFLNTWELHGSVSNSHARLLTPLFPLKNRISSVALRFNNDTVAISDISMRVGNSDLAISGQVTNVRRALTSATHDDLKVNLSIISDTIDINEIAATVFTGASYASDKRHGKEKKVDAKDDRTLEEKLAALSKAGPGRSAPVLIPVNIDGNLRLEANNVVYSDISMQDLGGDILVYDGGVSVNKLNAYSDAGNLSISALYSAPRARDMHFGLGLELKDFDIAKVVKLVPAIDSITPLMHDFSGMVGADIAATCRIDSGMNIDLPSLDAAIRIQGDNLAFIDPEKYRTLGKWLGFKDKADNTIHSLNVEMTVDSGRLRVYPFAFNIDRYRLGVYGTNDLAMNFDYHLSVLKSPLPFKFGVTISGNPKKYKVRFGGAKFNEGSVVAGTDMVNHARINLMDEIQNVFKRGVRNSRFAKLQIATPAGFAAMPGGGLSAADSARLVKEGILPGPGLVENGVPQNPEKKEGKFRRFFTNLWDKTKTLWHRLF